MANDFVSTATGGKSGSLRDALIELFVHVLVTRHRHHLAPIRPYPHNSRGNIGDLEEKEKSR
ncbi:hypothetical protein FRC02_001185 [Tulasnella sp. 418]|nr:hypothetical protein FRC02_001185 [Tulasnella sp. 418]